MSKEGVVVEFHGGSIRCWDIAVQSEEVVASDEGIVASILSMNGGETLPSVGVVDV